jgi:hypothetical protein
MAPLYFALTLDEAMQNGNHKLPRTLRDLIDNPLSNPIVNPSVIEIKIQKFRSLMHDGGKVSESVLKAVQNSVAGDLYESIKTEPIFGDLLGDTQYPKKSDMSVNSGSHSWIDKF